MLILSRKVGQVIKAGEIKVTVVRISGDSVRLGLEAPPYIVVDREEVYDKKVAERRGFIPEGLELLDEEGNPSHE